MMAFRHGVARRAKILLLAVAVVFVTLVLTQDGQPVGASHTEIFFTRDTANPVRVGTIVTSPTSRPILIHIWAQDPHDPVWDSGIGAFDVEIQFDPSIVVASASEVPFPANFNQCTNRLDDDPVINFDGFVNDGCPQVGDTAETGADCLNDTDDDLADAGEDHAANGGIGFVNDGCPPQGSPIESNGPWLSQTTGRAVSCSAAVVGPVSQADPTGTWRAGISCGTIGLPPPFGVSISGHLATLRLVGGTQFNIHNMANLSFLTTPGLAVTVVGAPETDQCSDGIDNEPDGVINDGCPAVGPPEFDQCGNADDDDLDDFTNDGCPSVGTNGEALCFGAVDDDADGRINDGCPQVGATAETGAQCLNALDDDGDEAVNDGCPAFGDPFESGTQCAIFNAIDEDGDGAVNDGCPAVGIAEDAMFNLCLNATNDDGDAFINDGCPAVGLGPEFDQCGNLVDDDGDGAVDDGCVIDPEVIPATTFGMQIKLARCPDLNGDGVIAIMEFLIILRHFGQVAGPPSSPGWDPNVDLNGDGAIALGDFLAVLQQFNTAC